MTFDKQRAKRLLLLLVKQVPILRHIVLQREELSRIKAELEAVAAERDRFKTGFAPGHFYSPVPDLRELKSRESELFGAVSRELPAVNLNLEGQQRLLHALAAFYPELPFTRWKQSGQRYYYENSSFGHADAIVLFSMIRYLKPRKIIEIGCGFSSCVILDTNERFFSNAIRCTFIDPFPQLLQALMKPGDESRVEILQHRLQDVPLQVFTELEANDILFVDSSHLLRTGGDLNHVLFQVLPRLPAGVYVHFHDTPFPFEYPKEWVFEGRAWNECYALRAFLQYNEAFEIVYFNSYLAKTERGFLERNMPLCLENEGGSLWLRKAKADPRLELAPRRLPDFVPGDLFDAVHLDDPRQLGRGWYECDSDLARRWTGVAAEVILRGPHMRGQEIEVRGYQPNPNGVRLTLSADNVIFAEADLRQGSFIIQTGLPDAVLNRERMLIKLEIDKPYRPAGTDRDLGLAFGTIKILE
jgi:hypothetical protein